LIRSAATELRNYALLVVEAIDCGMATCGSSLAGVLEAGFVDLLLTLQPHTQGEKLVAAEAASRADRIRAVTQYIDDHLDRKLAIEQLADVAGCSVRSLQATFMELCGMTPTEFVRRRRLAVARELLEAPEGDFTVTDVAQRTGFTQLARFSGNYKAVYGEYPSQTLGRVAVQRSEEKDARREC
jgi:transcriptional regulator GlxA family with amidase domain